MFRREALEKLSSPEQLDQLLRVTSPRGWLALLGLTLLIGAVVVWSVIGSIPSTIKGQGILLRGEGVQLIEAPSPGRVSKILVRSGDSIRANQPVVNLTTADGDTQISSPRAGRVLELRVGEGTFVQPGSPLVSFELAQEDLEAVLYLSPDDGKKVHPGMEVQVAPATVSQQEYGVLRGTVKSVSDFPVTVQGMLQVLGSDELVRELSSQSAPIEIRVELVKADTTSGYQWSSPRGPETTIQGGTFCTATIILGQRRPISLVLGG
jgi:multidrug efflux pump subunit AcrA (membrane-fusion protein)